MVIKKVSAVIIGLLALCAFVASSSSAAVTTTRAEFYKGSTPGTTLTEDLSVTAALAEHPTIGKKATFAFTVASVTVDITAEEIECVGCKITNKEVTGKAGAIAYGEGKLRFKKATVMEPANCTISGEGGTLGEVLTKSLVIHADWMDTNAANQKAFVQFIPAAGATATFAQYSLGGAGCEAIAGAKNVTGTLFAESVNNTGVFSKTQGLVFSPAAQETAGGSLSTFGVAARLTATVNYSVGGTEFTVKP